MFGKCYKLDKLLEPEKDEGEPNCSRAFKKKQNKVFRSPVKRSQNLSARRTSVTNISYYLYVTATSAEQHGGTSELNHQL